jgi:hypothetical protein
VTFTTRPYTTTSLPEAIGDPRRRLSEGKIRHRFPDTLVYVEGPNDAEILSELLDSRNLKFTYPPWGSEYSGKKGILRMLEADPQKFAVLDMDYDFSGGQLARVSNAIDTRMRCCLQSYFLETEQLPVTFIRIARSIYQKDTQKQHELKDFLTEHWNLIKSVALERTYARLFRGKFGIKLKMRRKGNPPTASAIINQGIACIQDLVESQHQREFQLYKRKNAHHLSKVGINDHAFEEVIVPFICKYDPELSVDFTLSRSKVAIKKYIIQHLKHSNSIPIAQQLAHLITANGTVQVTEED